MAARRNLLFTDSETLGLNPNNYELIELGAILTTPDGLKVLDQFEAKVQPRFPQLFETKAAEVNGYNPVSWQPTMAPRDAALKFCGIAEDVTLVGQNIGFDEGHILAFLSKLDLKPTWHYHKVDCAALAWPLFVKGRIKFVSLNTVREYFGLPKEVTPHRALQGAMAAREVYLKLMELYVNIA